MRGAWRPLHFADNELAAHSRARDPAEQLGGAQRQVSPESEHESENSYQDGSSRLGAGPLTAQLSFRFQILLPLI